MKKLLMIMLFLSSFTLACEPQNTTQEDKEAVKQDTVDPREGKGEGDVGEGVYGN